MTILKYVLLISLFSLNLSARTKTKSAAPGKLCPDAQNEMQNQYAREFELSKAEKKEVYLTYKNFGEVQLVQAVHSKYCSPKGCNTSLFYTEKNACPKLVLNFTGLINFAGPEAKPYESIRVTEKTDAVDGGSLSQRNFKFDRASLTYLEIKN